MRQKVKKSVSILPEGDVKIISFISDFSMYQGLKPIHTYFKKKELVLLLPILF